MRQKQRSLPSLRFPGPLVHFLLPQAQIAIHAKIREVCGPSLKVALSSLSLLYSIVSLHLILTLNIGSVLLV